MRTYKFRAWHTANKVMYQHKIIPVLLKNVQDNETWKYMQFTGLHDKNGVEIYEGDLLIGHVTYMKGDGYKNKQAPDCINVICVCEFNKGSFERPRIIKAIKEHEVWYKKYNYRSIGYFLQPVSKHAKCYIDGVWIQGDGITCYNVEVIGNIHENNDLIK